MPFEFNDSDKAENHRVDRIGIQQVPREVRHDCVCGFPHIALMVQFVPDDFPERFRRALSFESTYKWNAIEWNAVIAPAISLPAWVIEGKKFHTKTLEQPLLCQNFFLLVSA